MKILQFPLKLTTGLSIILSSIIIFIALVTWLAARETIATVAPIAVWILFALGLIVAIVIGLDRVQWFLLRRAEFRRDQSIAKSAGRQAKLQADREQMNLIFEGRMMATAARQSEQGLLHASKVGSVGMTVFPRQVVNQIEAPGIAPVDNSLNFETIATQALASRGAGRFIVYGGMHGGKTTLAKHTTSYAVNEIVKRQSGQVFVIDPHAPKTIWSDDVTVIGAGKDYGAIRRFLDWVISDIDQRYEDGCGDDSRPLPEPHKPNFIVCEEWCGVVGYLMAEKLWTNKDVQAFYMDARKAGWGYMMIVQEFTVGALGIQGKGNLLNGVEYFITLAKDAINNVYQAKIGTSFKDKAPYNLITPGPFSGPLFYSKTEMEIEKAKTEKYLRFDDLTFVVAESEPNQDENRTIEVFEALRGGEVKSSWNAVVRAAYGDNKTGKFYHDKLKGTLDKFKIDY